MQHSSFLSRKRRPSKRHLKRNSTNIKVARLKNCFSVPQSLTSKLKLSVVSKLAKSRLRIVVLLRAADP